MSHLSPHTAASRLKSFSYANSNLKSLYILSRKILFCPHFLERLWLVHRFRLIMKLFRMISKFAFKTFMLCRTETTLSILWAIINLNSFCRKLLFVYFRHLLQIIPESRACFIGTANWAFKIFSRKDLWIVYWKSDHVNSMSKQRSY